MRCAHRPRARREWSVLREQRERAVRAETEEFVEGTAVSCDGSEEQAVCVCANVGGERDVQTLDDEETVDLEPLERKFVTLDTPAAFMLDTVDTALGKSRKDFISST